MQGISLQNAMLHAVQAATTTHTPDLARHRQPHVLHGGHGQFVQLLNYSGCGNTVSGNHPVTQRLIIDSLKMCAARPAPSCILRRPHMGWQSLFSDPPGSRHKCLSA